MIGTVEADVLVVGGGAAAERAALEATLTGANTVVAVKGRLGAVGTRGGGTTASGTAQDWRAIRPIGENWPPEVGDPSIVYGGIIQLGLGMADRKLARVLVEGLPTAKQALEEWGVVFRMLGGHPEPYACSIVPTLAAAIRRAGVQIFQDTMIVDLLVQDGACVGALGVDVDGEVIIFSAGAVILGTGGEGHLYKFANGTSCVTGDGYAMGYRAGAELMNMEFKQIAFATIYPNINNLPYSWDASPRISNGLGEEFLERYLPSDSTLEEAMQQRRRHSLFSTRDPYSRYIDLAIVEEVKAGRATPHGGIYMDLTSPKSQEVIATNADFRVRFWDWLRYRGVDWRGEKLEICPSLHCSHGGFRIDENGQTSVPMLYAVGEAAAGPHGADRYWGNMIGATQVFGARAGRHAARETAAKPRQALNLSVVREALRPVNEFKGKRGAIPPETLCKRVQQVAWENMLVAKDEPGLKTVLHTIDAVNGELTDEMGVSNPIELGEGLELRNLLVAGEIVAKAALTRTESRGNHFRKDFPQRDDARWLKVVTLKNVNGRMEVGTLALDPEWKDRAGDMGTLHWG